MTLDTRNPEETGQAVTSFVHFLRRKMPNLFIESRILSRRCPISKRDACHKVIPYQDVFLFNIDHFTLHIEPRRFCRDKPDKFITSRDQNATGISIKKKTEDIIFKKLK